MMTTQHPTSPRQAELPEDFLSQVSNHRLVPVVRKIPADTVTPISLFQRFDDHQHAFLLESVLGGERWARYSIMGRKPLIRLVCRQQEIHLQMGNGPLIRQDTDQPIDLIRFLLDTYSLPAQAKEAGFRCGLVGYFAYDFIRYLERLPDANPDPLMLPDCDLMAPSEVLLYDHLKGELSLICNLLIEDPTVMTIPEANKQYRYATQILDALGDVLASGEYPRQENSHSGREGDPDLYNLAFTANVTRQQYMDMVVQAKQYIRQGDIFQVVLSQRLTAAFDGDDFAVYRALRQVNPSPYLFFMRKPDAVIVGASPEMLVRLNEQTIETCPIAGTSSRSADPEEDERLAEALRTDKKELAEHAMLVDLARNDVGRISRFGSVRVADFCHVERFSHVMHLVSLVEGQLREDRSAIDVLSSLLPAGTLSGAPKIRAMEIIDELENCRRGPYGGAVGYLGFDGKLDTCITIRTAILKDRQIHIQAGAGIVADSVPEKEYEECLNKARALFSAIKRAGDFA